MIITQQKELNDILRIIKNSEKIFLVGCNLCATVCKTGGEKQLLEIKEKLEKNRKIIVGSIDLDPACNILAIKRFYRKFKLQLDNADAILSFACGAGTQSLMEIIVDKEIFPGNNTLFQGEITESSLSKMRFEQKCSLCGNCILDVTGDICPNTRCAKSLLNGPCGGNKNGKCEVNSELDCVWVKIYERLKKLNRLDEMKIFRFPKDNKNKNIPQHHIIK